LDHWKNCPNAIFHAWDKSPNAIPSDLGWLAINQRKEKAGSDPGSRHGRTPVNLSRLPSLLGDAPWPLAITPPPFHNLFARFPRLSVRSAALHQNGEYRILYEMNPKLTVNDWHGFASGMVSRTYRFISIVERAFVGLARIVTERKKVQPADGFNRYELAEVSSQYFCGIGAKAIEHIGKFPNALDL
jgi:hypothetical protein